LYTHHMAASSVEVAPFPSLPRELVHCIARKVATGGALVAIERLCVEWRAAVTQDCWRIITLRRFPQVVKLIEMLNMSEQNVCYRDAYRDQHMVRFRRQTPPPDRATSVNHRLTKFVFTISLSVCDAVDSVHTDPHIWTGYMQEGPIDEVNIQCVGCQVWDESARPSWANTLLDQVSNPAVGEEIRKALRLTMHVTKATPSGTGTSTLCLCSDLEADSGNGNPTGANVIIPFGYVGDFFNALPQLPFTSLECLRVFGSKEEGELALDGPRIRPYLDVRNGILDGVFTTAEGESDDVAYMVKPEVALDYLERFARW